MRVIKRKTNLFFFFLLTNLFLFVKYGQKGLHRTNKIRQGTGAYFIASETDKFGLKINYTSIKIYHLELAFDTKRVVPILLQQIFGAYSIARQCVLALRKRCLFQRNTLYTGHQPKKTQFD